MSLIDHVLDLLDDWRHLPDYQLERRADIFFAAYLPAFLAQASGTAVDPRLVPEFPVHIGTIYPHIPINQSFKIDYLALAADRSRGWFIELKTDAGSRRDKQNAYLQAARAAGLPALLEGLIKICAATSAKHKYAHLLRRLEVLGLLELPGEMDAALRSRHWASAFNACLPHVKVIAPPLPLDVVFLQPQAHADDEIGFDEFAAWLDTQPAPAKRCAASLRRWARSRAGWLDDTPDPRGQGGGDDADLDTSTASAGTVA